MKYQGVWHPTYSLMATISQGKVEAASSVLKLVHDTYFLSQRSLGKAAKSRVELTAKRDHRP